MQTTTNQPLKLSEIRSLAKWTGPYLRDVIRCLNENGHNGEKLIISFSSGFISPKEYINDEVLTDDSGYYSENSYCRTIEGEVMHRDEAAYCEYYEDYTSDPLRIYIGNSTQWWSRQAVDNSDDLHYYSGDYYDYNALERHDLVIMPDGTVEDRGDVYYNEDTDEYQYHEPRPREPEYIRGYHNGGITWNPFTDSPRFYIGYEIEKEDKEVKQSIEIKTFEEKCPGWRKEYDASLDRVSGYELVSPAFELIPDKIAEAITSNPVVLAHVNAKENRDSCGGHINVSEAGLTGSELFDRMKGYTPLFYALYHKRVNKDCSKGKSNKDLKETNEKYQAIRIHSRHLEYRIISAVPNLETLLWRTELFNLLLNNQTGDPLQGFFNSQSILKSHLQIMYKGSRFDTLTKRLVKFTAKFEGLDMDKYLNS